LTYWEQIESMRKGYNGYYGRKAKTALKSQVKPVYDFIEQSGYENIEYSIDNLIDNEKMTAIYIDLYRKVGLRFRKKATRDLAKKGLQEDLWMQEMEQYVTQVAGERITWVAGTTKKLTLDTLRDVLAIDFEGGAVSIGGVKRKLIKELKFRLGKVEDWRALRIAHTEVMTASNKATHLAEDEISIPVVKRWITAPYGVASTEERHTLMDLESQSPHKGEAFNVGGTMMQYPGDPAGGAENVINCRCTIAYEPI